MDAVTDVQHVLEHDPAAVELIDLACDIAEFKGVTPLLPDGTCAAPLIEFDAEDDEDGRKKTASLVADRVKGGPTAASPTSLAAVTGTPSTRWKPT